MDPITLIGITGATIVLIAFVLNQTHKWSNDSLNYDLANALGSGLLIVYALLIGSLPFLVLNSVWGFVSLWGMWQFLHTKHHAK